MNAAVRDHYHNAFQSLQGALVGARLPWLRTARRVAFDCFAELGFPTTREEDWRYTNVTGIEQRAFNFTAPESATLSAEQVDALALADAHLLVFVNGRYAARFSRPLPAGAHIGSLAATLQRADADRLEPLLAADDARFANGFAALNAAFWADGAHIDLPSGTAIEAPIHLLYVNTEPDLATHVRTLVHAGAGSRATIVEHFIGAHEGFSFTNARTTIIAGEDAQIEHTVLQQQAPRAFHIAAIEAQQARASRFTSCSFALGARLSRTDIATRFANEHCEASLYGLYMPSGRQHMDHHTTIDHASPHGVSREYYKGVLDGAARAVFNGKVVVQPGAQKTDAHQSNRNLLLSEAAEVDTKPQLEIYADDVKCSHGATVGQLDEQQIFYLRSRGVDERAARNVLTYAFAEEIVARCSVSALRQRVQTLLHARLPDAELASVMS